MQLVYRGSIVKKGLLLVQLDWIPEWNETVKDAAYKVHNVEHYNFKGESLGVWTNPCLCQQIVVPENVTWDDINDWAERFLDRDTPSTLDNLWEMYRTGKLVKPISHYISRYFHSRNRYTSEMVQTKDYATLIGSVNDRLTGKIKALTSTGIITPMEPGTIDIGCDPAEWPYANTAAGGYTWIAKRNPAANTVNLDSLQIYMFSGDDVDFGTFEDEGSAVFSTHDTHAWLAVQGGSTQVLSSGVSLAALAEHYLGVALHGGTFSRTDSGSGTGVWYQSGDYAPCSSQGGWSTSARDISIFASGPGGGGASEALAGVSSGVASVTGVISVARSLAGASTGTTSPTAAISVSRALTASITSTSVVSGAIKVARSLAGSSSGTSTVSGILSLAGAVVLSAISAGVSTVTGSLRVVRSLAGNSAGVTNVSAAVRITRNLAASISAGASVSGVLSRVRGLSASASGSTIVSAAMKVARSLTGNTAGVASAAGAIKIARALSGLASGIASVFATLRTIVAGNVQELKSDLTVEPALSSNLQVMPALHIELSVEPALSTTLQVKGGE